MQVSAERVVVSRPKRHPSRSVKTATVLACGALGGTRGTTVGQQVRLLMQLHSIRIKRERCFEVTTDSNDQLPISPNLHDRDFTGAESCKVWVSESTFRAPIRSQSL